MFVGLIPILDSARLVPISALTAMPNNLLILHPVDPCAAPDWHSLRGALRGAGLIGGPMPQGGNHFRPGDSFFELVTFLGCSPVISLGEPGATAEVCHVEVPEPAPASRFIAGENLKPPPLPRLRLPQRGRPCHRHGLGGRFGNAVELSRLRQVPPCSSPELAPERGLRTDIHTPIRDLRGRGRTGRRLAANAGGGLRRDVAIFLLSRRLERLIACIATASEDRILHESVQAELTLSNPAIPSIPHCMTGRCADDACDRQSSNTAGRKNLHQQSDCTQNMPRMHPCHYRSRFNPCAPRLF